MRCSVHQSATSPACCASTKIKNGSTQLIVNARIYAIGRLWRGWKANRFVRFFNWTNKVVFDNDCRLISTVPSTRPWASIWHFPKRESDDRCCSAFSILLVSNFNFCMKARKTELNRFLTLQWHSVDLSRFFWAAAFSRVSRWYFLSSSLSSTCF